MRRSVKPAVFTLCLLPLMWLVWQGLAGQLGANPIEAITHRTGDWTLRLLLISLAMTPLRRLSGWTWPVRIRRMLGLFAFFYATLHLVTYLWLDQFFDWGEILQDIAKRPFVTVGMLGFAFLLPLAATSNQHLMKRLGKNWKRLHQLAYVVPVLGVLHFLWLVKADIREPVIYATVLLALLGERVWWQRSQRARPQSDRILSAS
jgi:sulfoxide reductase heme-binding subunit YedZ